MGERVVRPSSVMSAPYSHRSMVSHIKHRVSGSEANKEETMTMMARGGLHAVALEMISTH